MAMSFKERLETIVLGCFGSILSVVVLAVGALIMAWLAGQSAYISGIPVYKAISIGAGIFLILALAIYIISAAFTRYRQPESGLSKQSAAEQGQEETEKDRRLPEPNRQPIAGPQIIGRINEEYFYPVPYHDSGEMLLYVALNVHVANDGIATLIQGFRLVLIFFNREYQSEPVSCADFRIVRAARHNEEITEELTDLRASNNVPLKRHHPRGGWLCFQVGGLPIFKTTGGVAMHEIRLRLDVIDGADEAHSLSGSPPFNQPGRLERVR